MDILIQNSVDRFLRTYAEKFTIKDMIKFLGSVGVKVTAQECAALLGESPWVFTLAGGTYVTRAGAFTGEIFSIRPTAKEFEQGVLVPGSRCVPFVDGEMVSSTLSFFINGKKLPKKVGVFDCDTAIDIFQLYGEEYAPQYIASDPANATLDMVSREFDLPNSVCLTGIDMEPLVKDYGFKLGDRILCSVMNWDKGTVQVMVVRDGENKFNRGIEGGAKIMWYENMEAALLESFKRLGPCGSMEEQLGNVFFENSRELCVPLCGSFEEYLNSYSNKVGIEHFGVESRLWYKGEDVPAVGSWNSLGFEGRKLAKAPISFGISQEIMEQYICDMLFRKDTDFDKLIERIYPEDYVFHKDEKSYILEMVKGFYASIKEVYNWFADRIVGKIRQSALELYSKVSTLVYKIDNYAEDVQNLPQQELVILTQLYGHLYRILHSVDDIDAIERDSDAILMSIDGMKWNFEDIRGTLEAALERQMISRFKVVRGKSPDGFGVGVKDS